MRTRHSFYNMIINLVSSLIIPVLGFVKVRLFIQLYGNEVNGMQLTLMQFITYLNIFELAYSLAFRQLMYKPLADNDHSSIIKIYGGAKKVFRITGVFLLVAGVIFSVAAPSLTGSSINPVEISVSALILVLPFALSYFMMGPNFLLAADQKEYKFNIWIQTIGACRMIVMITIILLKLPYIVILIVEGLQILLANFIARKIALKEYPWLRRVSVSEDVSFLKSIKYTLANRFAVIANNNTDNIIISNFYGYDLVSIYGTYSYFIEAITKIVNSIITSPVNSFGNLFNDQKSESYSVFMELYSFSTYLGTIISICVFVVMNQLVGYWINDESYILTSAASFIFAINIFYMTQREPILICRDTNGLFKKAVGNSYLIAFVKILLSILLVKKHKIIGVLVATSISWWIIDFFYTPVLIYKEVFNLPALKYYKSILIRIAFFLGLSAFAYVGWSHFNEFTSSGLLPFLVSCVVLGSLVLIGVSIIYVMFFPSFRSLIQRFLRLVLEKNKK